MLNSSPLHGAVFVKSLAEDLRDAGFSDKQIFAHSGLNARALEGKRPMVAFAKVAAFFENAANLTGNDILGLEQGIKRDGRLSGLISYVGTASPTAMDAIKNIARYRRVFSDAIDMNTDTLQRDGQLSWHFLVPSKVKRRQHVEFTAIGLVETLRHCTNRNISPEWIAFRHSRNTNLDVVRRKFGCRVMYDQSDNGIQFKPTDLELPLVTADNHLYSVLTDYCDEVLQRKSRNSSNLLLDVERSIANRLTTGEISQTHIAKAMGMSPRTLARRLAKEETTFFKTMEDLRRSLAEGYLTNSDLVLAEIAFLLGYSGLSSFNDAFKRWTGKTPGQFRGR